MLTLALTRPAALRPPDEDLTSLAKTFLSDSMDHLTFLRAPTQKKEQQREERGGGGGVKLDERHERQHFSL